MNIASHSPPSIATNQRGCFLYVRTYQDIQSTRPPSTFGNIYNPPYIRIIPSPFPVVFFPSSSFPSPPSPSSPCLSHASSPPNPILHLHHHHRSPHPIS